MVPEMSVMKRNLGTTPTRCQRLTYSEPSSQTVGSSFTEQVTLSSEALCHGYLEMSGARGPRIKLLASYVGTQALQLEVFRLHLTLGWDWPQSEMGDLGLDRPSGGPPRQAARPGEELLPPLLSLSSTFTGSP